jgi:hypothetical protein
MPRRSLNEGQKNNFFEGDHEDAVQEQRREHVLVDGNARNAKDSAKINRIELRYKHLYIFS